MYLLTQDTEVEFYIDMHAHSTLSNCFMYGNIYDDEVRFQRQSVFPRLMCAICDDFSYANTAFNRDTVKAGTGRRWVDWYFCLIIYKMHESRVKFGMRRKLLGLINSNFYCELFFIVTFYSSYYAAERCYFQKIYEHI